MGKTRLEAFSDGVIAVAAIIWVIPDRRIEKVPRIQRALRE